MAVLLAWLAEYGYAGVFAAAALENVFPLGLVTPGSIFVLSTAASADATALNPVVVALLASAGETLGQLLSYAIGWMLGPRAIARMSGRFPALARRLDRGMAYFRTRGGWALVLGRAVWGVKAALPMVAGMARMPPWKAITLFVVSSLYYYPGLVAIAYPLGLGASGTTDVARAIGIAITILFVLASAAALFTSRRNARRERATI